jgi:glycosyltransferase involved in cell wall biosynthesis
MRSNSLLINSKSMSSKTIIFASLMRLDGTTGVQSHMREFHDYLLRQGVAHEVATPFGNWTYPVLIGFIALRRVLEMTWKAAAVWLYRSGHAYLLQLHLSRLLKRHPDCVVYAQCPLSASVALKCTRGPRQHVALVVHFNISQAEEWIGKGMINSGGAMDRQIRALEQSVVKQVHGLVFVSEFMLRELSQLWSGIDPARCAVIPNFVKALSGLSPLPQVMGRDLISIGTLEPRKNQLFLLKVLAEAHRRGHRLTMTLVGDGPDRANLEKSAQAFGIASHVFFEGFSPEGRTYIPGHKLYVHAALMENLPVVLLESLSAGVPVVAGQVGGIPEIFSSGVEGCFWSLHDVSAACDVLLSVLSDEQRMARMSRAALARFSQRFDVDAVAANLRGYLVGLT